MLLAAIESQLKWVLFGSQTGVSGTFSTIFPNSSTQPTVGDPIPFAGYGYNILGNALPAALGGGFNGNTNNFDWTNGVSPTTILINAVDTAITNLGGLAAQPWGLMMRGTTQYRTSIFGTVPGVPVLNRSAYYKINELNKCRTTHKEITFCGQSGDPLSPHYVDQLNDQERWILDKKKTFKNCKSAKKSCSAKSRLDGKRIKYKYTPYPSN